ncbi:carbon-nitrogen hydrolase family protein [Luedemannella helvata]|uniref:Carbon-nitrogen hydrolase family protein n=1 Tax=Luedemannella helvata TaxID=349315 RepID=A0ABN2L6W9_9ACTN
MCQLNSRADRAANLAVAADLLARAADAGADLAVLPEYVDYLGPADGEPKPEPVDGKFAEFFAAAAARHGMWVAAGSFHEAGPDAAHTYNTSLVFDRGGALAAAYRKIHLFDVEIPGRAPYRESATVAPGDEVVTVAVDGVDVGLSICYDLRFPELYRRLTIAGARVLLVPAAFTAHTGRDHWEVLLRARAIESQCYVVAAGQIGDHEPGRSCFGRSMIIDPWGTVVAQVPDTVGIAVADLDMGRVAQVRQVVPSVANRRLG